MEIKNQKQAPVKPRSTLGERSADKLTAFIGSWRFIIIQASIIVVWLIINIVAWINTWDPYPFILLNLMLSLLAAFFAPAILMSQNRMGEKDRRKAEADLATDRRAERAIIEMKKQLDRIENKKISRIEDTIGSKKPQN